MIKLIHMIDVNGTLKVTQGQRQNVKIKHAISVKLRRNLYLRGVNFCLMVSCAQWLAISLVALKVTQGQRQNVKIKHAICDKLRRNLYLRGVNVLVL